MTVENDEVSYGLNHLLALRDALLVVIDRHHHWVASGTDIQPADPRIAALAASWRKVHPMAHVSAPREALIPDPIERDLRPHGRRGLCREAKRADARAGD